MPQYSAILRDLTPEKFADVIAASSRRAREIYFHRHKIRAPQTRGMASLGSRKNEARLASLRAVFAATDDEQMAEEILRIYLLAKHRPLLAKALDTLGIAHEDGLTESDDVEKIGKLSTQEAQTLMETLVATQVAADDEVALYLRFMGAQLPPKKAA